MSPLWSGKNTKRSNYQAKPSPTCNDIFLDSAHNPGNLMNSRNEKSSFKYHFIEGISLLTSPGRVQAGITVEAAMVLPLFLFFVLNIGGIIEMIRFHGNMQLALWEVGSKAAVYAYAVEQGVETEKSQWEEFAGMALTATLLKWQLEEAIGESYLEQSPVIGGGDGLVVWESDVVKPSGEMELVVTYGVTSPVGIIGLPYFRMANQYYGHAWTGYRLVDTPEVVKETVYIAENAQVYHLFRDCTHLKLSIWIIPEGQVEYERNLYGGRYSACEKCVEGATPMTIFIAREGDRYHYVRECPGLKRTVYEVSEKDVANLPLCSRCDAREE